MDLERASAISRSVHSRVVAPGRTCLNMAPLGPFGSCCFCWVDWDIPYLSEGGGEARWGWTIRSVTNTHPVQASHPYSHFPSKHHQNTTNNTCIINNNQHTSQHAQRQWTIGNHDQAQLLTHSPQLLLLWPTTQQTVLHLHCCKRYFAVSQVGMYFTELLWTIVADPYCCGEALREGGRGVLWGGEGCVMGRGGVCYRNGVSRLYSQGRGGNVWV